MLVVLYELDGFFAKKERQNKKDKQARIIVRSAFLLIADKKPPVAFAPRVFRQ